MSKKIPSAILIYSELNKLRKDPVGYTKTLEKYIPYFKDKVMYIPERRAGICTKEGAQGFKDCIEWLKKQKPVKPLTPSKMVTEVAEKYRDTFSQTPAAEVGKIDMKKIAEEIGTYEGMFARCMEFGAEDHEQVIVNLLVADGNKDKKQRETLLNDEVERIGASCGDHKDYRTFTVIVTCFKFKGKNGNED